MTDQRRELDAADLRYARLAAALVGVTKRWRANGDMLTAQRVAVQAMLTFLLDDPTLAPFVEAGPLIALFNDLHNAKARQGRTKPTNLMRHFRRGYLAATLDLLITHGGMKAKAAALWVEAECWRAGLHEIAGQKIKAKDVQRWRHDVRESVASAVMSEAFATTTAKYRVGPATLPNTQVNARYIIENTRRMIVPDIPESPSNTGKS